jgi:hypothetical protein
MKRMYRNVSIFMFNGSDKTTMNVRIHFQFKTTKTNNIKYKITSKKLQKVQSLFLIK